MCLAQTHFIQRCPVVDPTVETDVKSVVPQFCTGDIDVYQVPNVNLESKTQQCVILLKIRNGLEFKCAGALRKPSLMSLMPYSWIWTI